MGYLRLVPSLMAGAVVSMQFCSMAATQRTPWVEQEVYNFNRPFAVQLPQELQTKMQKMAVSPFAFYRGTAHILSGYEDPARFSVSDSSYWLYLVRGGYALTKSWRC